MIYIFQWFLSVRYLEFSGYFYWCLYGLLILREDRVWDWVVGFLLWVSIIF